MDASFRRQPTVEIGRAVDLDEEEHEAQDGSRQSGSPVTLRVSQESQGQSAPPPLRKPKGSAPLKLCVELAGYVLSSSLLAALSASPSPLLLNPNDMKVAKVERTPPLDRLAPAEGGRPIPFMPPASATGKLGSSAVSKGPFSLVSQDRPPICTSNIDAATSSSSSSRPAGEASPWLFLLRASPARAQHRVRHRGRAKSLRVPKQKKVRYAKVKGKSMLNTMLKTAMGDDEWKEG